MKQLCFLSLMVVLFTGCINSDITTLSKDECIKQGFHYKVEKRFNYRHGEYEIKSICFSKTS